MEPNLTPAKLRRHVLDMVFLKQSGHIGGSFSLAELVSVLYNRFTLHTADPSDDRLILSKGHAVPILYAALYEKGVISYEEMTQTFREVNSRLQGHPDRRRLPEMHATTGSLGQGLSIAIGHALAHKLKGKDRKAFCILGDGEMQEGQVWEAIMLAPKIKSHNLVVFLDRNGAQNDGTVDETLPLGDVAAKVYEFGWDTWEIDGHDTHSINMVLDGALSLDNHKPKFVVLNTIKGKGVSFMEKPEWHSKAPNREEYMRAVGELNDASNA